MAADNEGAAREALSRLGWSGPSAPLVGPGETIHPDVRELDGMIGISLIGVGKDAIASPWVLVAAGRSLLVIGDLARGEKVRAAVGECPEGRPRLALAAATLGLARDTGTAMVAVADSAVAQDNPRKGFSRAAERSEIRVFRGRLFALQEGFAAQARLLDDAEELAGLLDEDARRLLPRAQSIFDACRGTSARLYALAGDLLTEQSALVNERLTLVSTFFLPMTVSTGFFGMNFAWMTDRVGSAGAFMVLGVAVPALATLLTLAVVRRLGVGTS